MCKVLLTSWWLLAASLLFVPPVASARQFFWGRAHPRAVPRTHRRLKGDAGILCGDLVCYNDATCADDQLSCICTPGYGGPSCDLDASQQGPSDTTANTAALVLASALGVGPAGGTADTATAGHAGVVEPLGPRTGRGGGAGQTAGAAGDAPHLTQPALARVTDTAGSELEWRDVFLVSVAPRWAPCCGPGCRETAGRHHRLPHCPPRTA